MKRVEITEVQIYMARHCLSRTRTVEMFSWSFFFLVRRYDYFKRNLTPFMSQLKVNGTSADYMMNIFVTKTFPNHHTMATGLYAETHGVVDNEYYEPVTENVTKYSYKLYHYDNSILPIWVSRDILSLSYLAILILSFMIYDLWFKTVNEKSGRGRHSGTMMWPGSVFEYQGVSPTFAQVFRLRVRTKTYMI